jgi:hypothetical protein
VGLDMYLHAEKYVSGWDHNPNPAYDTIVNAIGVTPTNDSPSLTVEVSAYYWRKSNQIHAWFVENCQGGVDECQRADVYRKDLEQLIKVCSEVLESRDPSLLEPRGGFFFGSTNIDEYYWDDVKRTRDGLIDVLERFGEDWHFTYQSSW